MKATATKKAKALTLQQRCDRNNAAYKKATPAQRRVMIAKDALEQIKHEHIVPTTGNYISSNGLIGLIGREEPLQPLLLQEDDPISCRACAKGTLFLSCVRLSNRYNGSPGGIGSGGINALVGWPENNYHEIEAAFEVYYSGDYCDDADCAACADIVPKGKRNKAIHKWRTKYKDESKRLVAILNNIVRNNGLFKLKDV